MTPIDLTDYAYSSKKIPQKLLKHRPKTKQEVSTLKIMSGYLIDFYALVMATFLISELYSVTAQSLILTGKLHTSFTRMNGFFNLALPVTMISYFFFSFFFNEGQTWGMHSLKTRISMPSKDIGASFKWALYSSALLLTCGLIYPFTKNWLLKNELGKHESHDYLYETLLEEREVYALDLVKQTEQFSQDSEQVEEEYSIAA